MTYLVLLLLYALLSQLDAGSPTKGKPVKGNAGQAAKPAANQPVNTNAANKNNVKEVPTLPPCTDADKTNYCKRQLALRGQRHCTNSFSFGRYTCCQSCAAKLGNSTVLREDVVRVLSKPRVCADGTGADGKSLTNWCRTKVTTRTKQQNGNCWTPAFQARCMKSCGLC